MRLFEIEQVKAFTSQLFAGEEFDDFLLYEAQFSTSATFTIDGRVNEPFVGEEQMQLPDFREGFVTWRKLKKICFEIIKGRKVPQQFKVVLKLSEKQTGSFLREKDAASYQEQISALFLNISFRENHLTCTTGTMMKEFSMDKTLETLWDEYAGSLLKAYM